MSVSRSSNPGATGVDTEVQPLISADRIARRVVELGREISADYAGKSILAVGVLHGAYVFMADLVRRLTVPVRCAFLMARSYGDETITSGRVDLVLDVTESITGKHVLLVDDIVDTGVSTEWINEHLVQKQPASLRLCALLDKPARRRTPVSIDYVGFEIPDRFVVGYGIDYAGRYRELPFVGCVETDEPS